MKRVIEKEPQQHRQEVYKSKIKDTLYSSVLEIFLIFLGVAAHSPTQYDLSHANNMHICCCTCTKLQSFNTIVQGMCFYPTNFRRSPISMIVNFISYSMTKFDNLLYNIVTRCNVPSNYAYAKYDLLPVAWIHVLAEAKKRK